MVAPALSLALSTMTLPKRSRRCGMVVVTDTSCMLRRGMLRVVREMKPSSISILESVKV
jgi:hypothetical protein